MRGKSAFDVGAFAAADARAKESLEKLRKWERAFERDYGEWPTDEDKGNSNTYQSCERKYRQLVTQMEQLIEDVGGNPPGEVKVQEVSTTTPGGGGGGAVEDSGAGAIEEEVAALDVTDAAAELDKRLNRMDDTQSAPTEQGARVVSAAAFFSM